MHVAIVGTYPPTRCGIATFTADVEMALELNDTDTTVVSVGRDEELGTVSIERDDPASYVEAAHRLNAMGCDVVLIQHEFGIFGGEAGHFILDLVSELTIPYVVTLHTVLPWFGEERSKVVQELCRGAAAVTVFTATARRLLLEQELVPARLLQVVPHGAPAELFAEIDVAAARRWLSIPEDVPVMSTFGLLSEGKGIELALQAMALLTSEHPDLHYVVAGRTHPEVVKRDGERYRRCLAELVDNLGLTGRVIFLDRFLALDELAAVLGISRVVCTPYRGEDQSVSGVLTFALAAGCAIASTPYRYARDVLADGAGLLVDFGDDEAFADAIHRLLGPVGDSAREAARQASSQLAWPTVGAALRSVLANAARGPMVSLQTMPDRPDSRTLMMQPDSKHLRTLCDDTAVFQHARFNVPRVEHGYCVDDAARMLPIIGHLAVSTGDESWHATVSRLLSFLHAAAAGGDGNMRNFMSWDRRWLDEPYLGDHVGRAIWGLGELAAIDGAFTTEANDLLNTLGPSVSPAWPSRTLAYAALGLVAATPSNPALVDDLERISATLRQWVPSDHPSWEWCEPRLTYDNARVPEALLRVGHLLGERTMVANGGTMLRWFDELCLQGRYYRFPGHRGLSDARELRWSGDEQPLEAAAMADAQSAWLIATGDTDAAGSVDRAWAWFLGNNRLGAPMIDVATGAGFDGLGARSVNLNRGAESTIALHRCWLTRRTAQELSVSMRTRAMTITSS
ncbi:MAG: glycosyltransferase [Ilumatobacteraceae bacterium]